MSSQVFLKISVHGTVLFILPHKDLCLIRCKSRKIMKFLSNYINIFRLILYGYLERILIYDLTRNLITFGNMQLYDASS